MKIRPGPLFYTGDSGPAEDRRDGEKVKGLARPKPSSCYISRLRGCAGYGTAQHSVGTVRPFIRHCTANAPLRKHAAPANNLFAEAARAGRVREVQRELDLKISADRIRDGSALCRGNSMQKLSSAAKPANE